MNRKTSAHRALTVLLSLVAALGAGCASPGTGSAPAPPQPPPAEILGNVTVHPWSFNPSAGEAVEVRYELSRPARVTLRIYGPNRESIATLSEGELRQAGAHRERWDGRDWAGRVVPDEAYFPAVEAVADGGGTDRWDPLASSGGERLNPQEIHFRPQDRMVSYVLPEPARVLVRAGLDPGPMLATLVNWEPRGPGLSTEPWTGKDQQGLRSFSFDPQALVIVQAYALPDASVIAVGNSEMGYREHFLRWGRERPVKTAVESRPALAEITSPHWGQPVHLDKDPRITVHFPELEPAPPDDLEAALPLNGARALVRVEVPDAASRDFLRDQRFELVAFLDDVRIDEVEQGHLPFNWSWDLRNVEPGEHWLTINLVTFRQHVGAATRRVLVVDRESRR